MSVLMPVPCHLDYYSFVIQMEARECEASRFVLLSLDGFFCLKAVRSLASDSSVKTRQAGTIGSKSADLAAAPTLPAY